MSIDLFQKLVGKKVFYVLAINFEVFVATVLEDFVVKSVSAVT